MRALIADDSTVIRRFLKLVLEPEGLEITEAADGTEALQALQSGAPVDLAFLDWRMPGMDGYDVLKIMRSDPKFDRTRVLMVTTETDQHLIDLAMQAGADLYVVKPFTRDLIVETVHQLKGKSRRDQA